MVLPVSSIAAVFINTSRVCTQYTTTRLHIVIIIVQHTRVICNSRSMSTLVTPIEYSILVVFMRLVSIFYWASIFIRRLYFIGYLLGVYILWVFYMCLVSIFYWASKICLQSIFCYAGNLLGVFILGIY